MLQVMDEFEFPRYDVGPRRTPAAFFKWAGVDIQNNWGPGAAKPVHSAPNVSTHQLFSFGMQAVPALAIPRRLDANFAIQKISAINLTKYYKYDLPGCAWVAHFA